VPLKNTGPRQPWSDAPWARSPYEDGTPWTPRNALHCCAEDPEGIRRNVDWAPVPPAALEKYDAIEDPGPDAPLELMNKVFLRCRCGRARRTFCFVDVRGLPSEVTTDRLGRPWLWVREGMPRDLPPEDRHLPRQLVCGACRRSWFRANHVTEAELVAMLGAPEPVVLKFTRLMHRRGRRPARPDLVQLPELPFDEVKQLRRDMFRRLRQQDRTEPRYAELPPPPDLRRGITRSPGGDG
jgi:hypothetical protein